MSDVAASQRLPMNVPESTGGGPMRAIDWARRNLFSSVFNSILTIVVLLIAMVQIVITRPRADDDAAARAGSPDPVAEVPGAVAGPAVVEQLEPDPRVVGE